ncbi:hypothetical protein QTP88_026565 [Uroleucon formosanum]
MVEQNLDEPDEPNEKRPQTSQPQILSCQPSATTNINTKKTRPLQTRVDSYITKPISMNKQKILNEQLAIMIAKEFQPFSLVENEEFKKFVHLLNPGYKLLSRKTVSKSLLPQLLNETKERVKNNLNNAQFIAFTTDELKLIQDVTTRWNSTFDMFQRCILIKEPLISTIAIIGNVDNLIIEDFEIMQHYCEIFKPFKEATVELSSEKGVSISKVLILTQMLHSHIKNNIQNIQLPHTIHLMLSKMLTKADKKFEGIENQRVLLETEATLLDPRFKKKAFDNHIIYQRTYDRIVEKIAATIKRNKNNDEQNINTPLNNNAIENETSEIWKHFDAKI